jgi:hypothetical protein
VSSRRLDRSRSVRLPVPCISICASRGDNEACSSCTSSFAPEPAYARGYRLSTRGGGAQARRAGRAVQCDQRAPPFAWMRSSPPTPTRRPLRTTSERLERRRVHACSRRAGGAPRRAWRTPHRRPIRGLWYRDQRSPLADGEPRGWGWHCPRREADLETGGRGRGVRARRASGGVDGCRASWDRWRSRT